MKLVQNSYAINCSIRIFYGLEKLNMLDTLKNETGPKKDLSIVLFEFILWVRKLQMLVIGKEKNETGL